MGWVGGRGREGGRERSAPHRTSPLPEARSGSRCRCTRQGGAGRGGAGQGRAGQGRAGQGRAGLGGAGQGRAGQGRAGALCASPEVSSPRGAQREQTPLHEAFLAAGREAGYPLTDDMNGYQQEGFGYVHLIEGWVQVGVRAKPGSSIRGQDLPEQDSGKIQN